MNRNAISASAAPETACDLAARAAEEIISSAGKAARAFSFLQDCCAGRAGKCLDAANEYVRQKPWKAAMLAACLGYFCAHALARRSRWRAQ